MVDHRELFEDVTATLARAGFDTGQGPSGLRIGHRPQGVVVGWTPVDRAGPDGAEDVGPPPAEGVRAAVSGAVALVLRESGYRVTETGTDAVLVTAGPPPAEEEPGAGGGAGGGAGADPEPAAVPEQWWG
ncbi:hypothetical protein ACFVHB_04550 [Kitasatospora sp. NPDC127111]|uniref:hypothetical protein n=1 Tax=Kitasatospora sp. NPDC127111 TaxID=3345363 RepID=UPI003645C62F